MEDIYIHFLVEDRSGSLLIKEIMRLYNPHIKYEIKYFHGIGTIPKNSPNKNLPKTGKLLNDLPGILAGLTKSLSALQYRAAIIVVLDLDKGNCAQLKNSLLATKPSECQVDVFFCIAIEEIEAWLLGDKNAIMTAYPKANKKILNSYESDSIIGTWEKLADVVYRGGIKNFRKVAPTGPQQGKYKCDWATQIGSHLNLRNNKSPSFNYLLSKLDLLCR